MRNDNHQLCKIIAFLEKNLRRDVKIYYETTPICCILAKGLHDGQRIPPDYFLTSALRNDFDKSGHYIPLSKPPLNRLLKKFKNPIQNYIKCIRYGSIDTYILCTQLGLAGYISILINITINTKYRGVFKKLNLK